MDVLEAAMRIFLALVLIPSGIAKFRQLDRFRAAVADYAIMPAQLVGVVALGVPLAEIAVGVGMFVNAAAAAAAMAAAVLFAGFRRGDGGQPDAGAVD